MKHLHTHFTIQATAKAISDHVDAESMAEAIVYPFALGTSIATSFGTQVQEFIVKAMGTHAFGSVVQGMDIEYYDAINGNKKYCQLKSGPTTINKDDIKTIEDHFTGLYNLARTNHINLQINDAVVGVLYGDKNDLSQMYKHIIKDGYVVLCGEDFWYHLTGYKDIYSDLVKVAQKAAINSEMKNDLQSLIDRVKNRVKEDPEFYGLKKDGI